jgi:hypothetical protein
MDTSVDKATFKVLIFLANLEEIRHGMRVMMPFYKMSLKQVLFRM